MPFIINIDDTASINATLAVTTNVSDSSLQDVKVTGVDLKTFLPAGTYYQLVVAQPSVSLPPAPTGAITNTVATIAGGRGDNSDTTLYTFPGYNGSAAVRVATVASDVSAQNLNWKFVLQSSTDNATWSNVLQASTSTVYTITVSGVNRTFLVAFAGSSAAITASTGTAGPQSGSIVIDNASIPITATSGALTTDYVLYLPEDTSTDNTNVSDVVSATIPLLAAVNLANGGALDFARSFLRGNTRIFPLATSWASIGFKSYKIGAGSTQNITFTTSLAPTGTTGITLATGVSGVGGTNYITLTLGISATATSITDLVVYPN